MRKKNNWKKTNKQGTEFNNFLVMGIRRIQYEPLDRIGKRHVGFPNYGFVKNFGH